LYPDGQVAFDWRVLELTGDRKSKFFYGYVIVLAGFGIQVIGWGIYTTYGVFFTQLLIEFGWTRAMLSGAASLTSLLWGFVIIIVGRLGDRFGPRMLMTGSGIFFGLGYLLMSQINTMWHLYLFYGVVVAIGTSGLDVLPLSAVARWFTKRRGMMSGIIKVGAGIGLLIMPLVASWLILSYGWRTSYLILGSVALIFMVLAAQFLRRDPGEKGLVPYGADEANAGANMVEEGFSLREAVHLKQFWILCAISAPFFFAIDVILVHIVPYGLDIGIPMASAAGVLSVIGGASIVGRLMMGSAGDRVGSRLALVICLFIMMVALLWLQVAGELWMLYLFAAVYGFAHGGFLTVLSPLVAELFGLRAHGVIFGMVTFSGAIGGALGPVLAGHIFDIIGSYRLGFLICALLVSTSFVLALWLRPTGSKALQSAGGI